MLDSHSEPNVPGLTRLVRACALLGAQGAAVGFAASTLRHWGRLPEFVANNRMSALDRKGVLVWLVLPALLWVTAILLAGVLRPRPRARLPFIERVALRGCWAVAAGLVPVLLHPTLWRARTLMFLIATGAVTLITWWAIRLTQRGKRMVSGRTKESDARRLSAYLAIRIPGSVKELSPFFVIGAAVAYVVLRGVWLDPTAVPKSPSEAPFGVHSLRQAFVVLGHAGWLGIPVTMMGFLRPPGHAHVFFWVLCVASAAFPLYLWARAHLGRAIALLLALFYLSMPVLRTIGRAEVLPLGVAAGLFFVACREWERRRLATALLYTTLAVGVHEQTALWFCCFGIYLAGVESTKSIGRWIALGSGLYFALVALFLLPRLGLGPYLEAFRGLPGAKAVGLVATLQLALTNPIYVLTRWVDAQDLLFWLVILVPFAFLPLAGRNWLLWMVPGAVFAIVSSGRAPGLPVTAGVFAHFIVLGFAASIVTLTRLRSSQVTHEHANAAVAAWCVAIVPCTYQLGGLWAPAP